MKPTSLKRTIQNPKTQLLRNPTNRKNQRTFSGESQLSLAQFVLQTRPEPSAQKHLALEELKVRRGHSLTFPTKEIYPSVKEPGTEGLDDSLGKE